MSVVKKRSGAHEVFIREMQIGPVGLTVGEPLTEFHGVLSGRPEYSGEASELSRERHHGKGHAGG